jgi:phage anti-repressor protein
MVEAGTAAKWEIKEISIMFEVGNGAKRQGTSYMMSLNVADQPVEEPTMDKGNEVAVFEPVEVNKGGKVWIDSRMIHTFLEVGRDYSTWFNQRIADIGMVKGVDYVSPKTGENPRANGRPMVFHYVTPDIAKDMETIYENG